MVDQFLLLRLLVFGRRDVRLHVELGGERQVPVLFVERAQAMIGEVRGRRRCGLRSLHVIGVLAVVQDRTARVSVNDIGAEVIVERVRGHVMQIVAGVEIVFQRLVLRYLSVLQFMLWRRILGVAEVNGVRSAERTHGARRRAGARTSLHHVRVRVRRARTTGRQTFFVSNCIILLAYIVNDVPLNSTTARGDQELAFNQVVRLRNRMLPYSDTHE